MRNISVIAAGVLALGWTTAIAGRAESADPAGAPDTSPPPLSQTNINLNPAPPSGTTAPSPADVDVNDNPPPSASELDANTAAINDNTAAIEGATIEPAAPGPVVVVPVETLPVADSESPVARRSWTARTGGGLLLGGGFEDFTNDALRSMTSGGGYWSARLVAGTRRYVGMEAAYVGGARGIDGLGLGSNARLISNGVEGAVRINIPIVSANQMGLFEPFGFVGLGWSHYNVTNTNINMSDVASKDDIMTLPFGGGLAFGYGGFLADARFTYRQTYYNNLTPGGNLNNWGVGGQVGFGF